MTISNRLKIIGLSGTFASGKDTLAKYLTEQCGCVHVSTGDMVREEAKKQFGNTDRPTCHKVAKVCREKNGAGFFVQKALAAQHSNKPLVISGIRTTGEAEEIKKAGGTLVFVDADITIRYERMKSRQRDDETQLSLEEFKQQEAKEWQAGEKSTDFNVKKVKEMADVVLENDVNLNSFLSTADERLGL